MTYYQISALINCISSFFIGIVVYLKNRKNLLNKTFSLFCISVGAWALGYFFWQIATNEISALLWCRTLMACASFISPSFFHFVTVLLELHSQKYYRNFIKIGYVTGFLFLLSSFSSLFVSRISSNIYFKYWPNPGVLYPFYLLIFFGYAIYAWYLMIKKYRTFTGMKRNQIRYVLLGTIIGYIGGSTNYPLWYNIPILPIGNCLVTAYVLLIGYAIVKYRLLDIHFIIRKTIINTIFIVLITSIIFAACLFNKNLMTKLFCSFIIAYISIIYIPKIKNKTENIITHILYKGKYDYLDRLEKFIEKMALIPKEEDLINNTIKVLVRDMYIEKASLFTIDHITNDYIIRQKVNIDTPEDFRLLQNNRITKWLKEHKEVFVLEEEEKKLPLEEINEIKKELEPLQAKVCVPVRMDSELTGIIALGNKSTGEMYTHVDIELLERLGIQLAVALDYKRIEGQLRKEQELAAIGQMSMEISHEMRNLLQSPTTFVDLILERKDDPSFMSTFRNLAQARLKVTSDKLYDIMYFGGERPPNFKPNIDINELLDSNILANDYNIKKVNVEVVKEYSEIPTVTADKSQLTHLFNNLIINAIDAMKDKGGKLRVRTKINKETNKEMEEKSDKWIRIEVKDDGTGIPDHVKEKLFTPFVTTKSLGDIERSGTGLGLPVVKKVVNAHKGYIYVNTKEGKGTTFAVDLPVSLKAPYMSNAGFIPGSMIFDKK